MKKLLYSARISAKSGAASIVRNVFVLAEDRAAANGLLLDYIQKDHRLNNSDIRAIILTEEAVIQ